MLHMDGYQRLISHLKLDKGVDYHPDWAAAPDFLELIVEYVLSAKPEAILECSSGLTTLVLARCCQVNGKGRVYSLENGLEYAEAARIQIRKYGLETYSEIIHAPLVSVDLAGEEYQWYELLQLPDCRAQMLVIDGPPGLIQHHSRFPALPLLASRLAPKSAIFLDDAARQDERELVARWLLTYPEWQHRYLETERGCSILQRDG